MTTKKIIHENVLQDGTFSDKSGAIETKGWLRTGRGEGCGLPGCHCSDGYYVSIGMPLKDGKVEGIITYFKSKKEMDKFLS